MKDYKKEAHIYYIVSWIILILWVLTVILSRFGIIRWIR